MPNFSDLRTIAMTGTGVVLPYTDRVTTYILTGSGTRASSYALTADLTHASVTGKPHQCRILYLGQWTLAGNDISFFDYSLTEQQALAGGVLLDCIYNGSVWRAKVVSDDSVRSYPGTEINDVLLTSPPTNVAINPNTNPICQIVTGTGALTGNYSLGPTGTINDGEIFVYIYKGTITPSGFQINLGGVLLTDEEITNGNVTVYAVYSGATGWITQKVGNPANADFKGVEGTDITAAPGTTITLTDGVSKQFQYLFGNGALGGAATVTFAGTFKDGATFFLIYGGTTTAFSVNLLGEVLTADQQLYGKCMLIAVWDLANTTFRTQLVQNPKKSVVADEVFIIPVSFETLEQADNSFIAPCNGTIIQEDAFVTKALANADVGLIDVAINGTPVTNGQISFPLSSALNVQSSATPTALNTFLKGDIISPVSSKATAGGKAIVSISYKRTP